jgi:hypothetical protein
LSREYLSREYLSREYLSREYLSREYLLREYLLPGYLLDLFQWMVNPSSLGLKETEQVALELITRILGNKDQDIPSLSQ